MLELHLQDDAEQATGSGPDEDADTGDMAEADGDGTNEEV